MEAEGINKLLTFDRKDFKVLQNIIGLVFIASEYNKA